MTDKPKLGTIDSALVNCVNMMAMVTSQRVEDLVGMLDLYFQIRYLWEVSQGHVTDPQLIRKDELLPILESTVREALRGTARKAAETVTEKRKRKQSPPDPQAETPEPEEKTPSTPAKPGPWTLYKRKIYDRLLQVRAEGYTIAQIAECSGGNLSEGRVMAAINAAQLRQEEWRALETALDAVTLLQNPANPGGGA